MGLSKKAYVGVAMLLLSGGIIAVSSMFVHRVNGMSLSHCKSATYNTAKTSADYVVFVLEASLEVVTKLSYANVALAVAATVAFAGSPELRKDRWFFKWKAEEGSRKSKTEKLIRFTLGFCSFLLSALLYAQVAPGSFRRAGDALDAFGVSGCRVLASDFRALNWQALAVFIMQVAVAVIGHVYLVVRNKK